MTSELLHDLQGRRLYLTGDERRAFLEAAAKFPRPVRTLCGVLAHTGCFLLPSRAATSQLVAMATPRPTAECSTC